MTTSTFQVNVTVRPVRIAFALQEPDSAILTEVFQLNAMLWGGMYNPIFFLDGSRRLRTGQQETFSADDYEGELLRMLKEFDPDVILNYSAKELPPKLKPFQLRTFPVSELRWNPMGHGQVHYFLEVWPFLAALWREEFRVTMPPEREIRYLNVLPDCDNRAYLAARFGIYPDDSKGNETVGTLFGAEAAVYDGGFRKSFVPGEYLFPLALTSLRVSAAFPSPIDNFVFLLLDFSNLFDLVDYWNLRAAGMVVFPLPLQEYKDFENGVRKFAERALYPMNPPFMTHAVVVKARSVTDEALDEVGRWIQSLGVSEIVRKGWFPRFGERGYRVAPELEVSPLRSKDSTHMVITERGYGTLQGPTPACEFSGNARFQHWTSELRFYAAMSRDQCYRLPWLHPECDKAANRAVGQRFAIKASRVSKTGLVVFQEGNHGDVHIHPLGVRDVLTAVLGDSGMELLGLSPPGLAVERIVENLGGLGGCDVFRNKGVRQLLYTLSDGSSMRADEARAILYKNTNEKLRKKTVPALLDFLCDKRVLRLGLEFQCSRCTRWAWYHIDDFGDRFTCQWCFTEQKSPRLDNMLWRYKSDGLFLLENKMEGCITVLLAIGFLQWFLHSEMAYVPSFKYKNGEETCESDFGVFASGFVQEDVDIVIGEAKTGHTLDDKERERIRTLVRKTGGIAAFCTQAADFAEDDKAYFRELVVDGQRVILLTGQILDMSYEQVMDYRSGKDVFITDADLLSRITTREVLGAHFADKYRIWL